MATGYGVEVSMTDQLVTGRLVSGKAIVLEAWYRRLTTPRGSHARINLTLWAEDLAAGFDVTEFVGAVGYQRAARTLAGMAENELSKDDRAHSVKAEATLTTDANGTEMLLLDIDGTLVDSGEDLALTLGVTSDSAEILAAS